MAKKSRRPTQRRRKRSRAAAGEPRSSGSQHRGDSGTPLFRAALAVSLDGYISDKDGGVAWLEGTMTPEIDFAGFMKTIGATIYGRTTFDWALAHGYAGGGSKHKVVVLTHRPLPPNIPGAVEAVSGDVRDVARRLREQLRGTGKDIWLMGGGLSIDSFHQAGLVDRWELAIIPVLLGDGIPLFPRHSRGLDSLSLTHTRALKNGIVEAHYEPKTDAVTGHGRGGPPRSKSPPRSPRSPR